MDVDLAGVIFLDQQKEESEHNDPKTEIDLLIHATIRTPLITSEMNASISSDEKDKNNTLTPSPSKYQGRTPQKIAGKHTCK